MTICSLFSFLHVQEFSFINFLLPSTFKCPFALQQDVIFFNALLPFSYPLTWINSRRWLVRVEEKGFSCLKENILRTVTIEMIGQVLFPSSPLSSLRISSYIFVPFLLFSPLFSRTVPSHVVALINASRCIYSRTKFYICSR